MTDDTIHTCSYECERPECIRAQRDELVAKVEALLAEVAEAREFRDKLANAIGNDQLRRFIEKHGEPVPLTIRMRAAEARAELLRKLLDRMVVCNPDGSVGIRVTEDALNAAAELYRLFGDAKKEADND